MTHWSEFLAMAIEAWRDAFTRGINAALMMGLPKYPRRRF